MGRRADLDRRGFETAERHALAGKPLDLPVELVGVVRYFSKISIARSVWALAYSSAGST